MDPLSALRRVSLFEGLDDGVLALVSERCRIRAVAAGQTLLYHGDEGGTLFILAEGRVSIQQTTPGGRIVRLADRVPGDCFGEMSLLDGAPRSADVVATEPCRLLLLDRREFERLVTEHPKVALNALRVLAQRLREQDERVTRNAGTDALAKLCALLLSQEDGEARGSQQAIAERIGVTRETANKCLRQLAAVGAVEARPGRVRVLDRAYLESRAQPM